MIADESYDAGYDVGQWAAAIPFIGIPLVLLVIGTLGFLISYLVIVVPTRRASRQRVSG